MILVDTSIWINHLRTPSVLLGQLLDLEQVSIHPFIVGELACGNLKNRNKTMTVPSFVFFFGIEVG